VRGKHPTIVTLLTCFICPHQSTDGRDFYKKITEQCSIPPFRSLHLLGGQISFENMPVNLRHARRNCSLPESNITSSHTSSESNQDHFLACFFLKASTVALPNVKMKNSSQMAVALMKIMRILSMRLNKSQTPIIAVGTLTTIHNSFHVKILNRSLSH